MSEVYIQGTKQTSEIYNNERPFWILILGDSLSTSDKTWIGTLTQLINAKAVINAAVSGTTVQTTVDGLATTLTLANYQDSPIILANFGGNDFGFFNS
ncbi:MAG TPA: hypothetical protein VNX68_04220, partial [Nitrosopumilaceae archaeon]|nr:hypothetical protein [Nitrosopumilaceae archaeon]